MILFIPNSQFTLRPENLDAAEITGVEWSNQFEVNAMWRFHLNYTYQEAINRSDISYLNGKYLPLRPLHEMHSGLSWFNQTWELGGEAVYVGATFRDRTNEATGYVPARWLYNFFMNFQFGEVLSRTRKQKRPRKRWRVNLDVKNVLDERATDINGFPLPGRAVYFSLACTF